MAAKHRPGRKKRPCKVAYNASKKWLMNKVKKIQRHLKKFPEDESAKSALNRAMSKI